MIEVKLVSRKDNPNDFGGGDLDWEVLEGHTTEIEDDNVIAQAIKKATIAKLDNVIGYGAAVHEFRGERELVPFRVGIMMRILRNISLISKWYHKPIAIEYFNIEDASTKTQSMFSIKLKINQGLIEITV